MGNTSMGAGTREAEAGSTGAEASKYKGGPPRRRSRFVRPGVFEAYALPLAWLVILVGFSLAAPTTFPTIGNISAMLASQAVLLVLTIALMFPLIANDFDLSVSAIACISAMLVAKLNVDLGMPVVFTILISIVVGLLVGFVNGFFIIKGRVYSLIVTLGMQTLLAGLVLWISDLNTITGVSPGLSNVIVITKFLGIPLAFWFGMIIVACAWYFLTFTAAGRRLLIVGRGPEVARLSGINVERVRWIALVAAGGLAGVAGIISVGISGSASPTGNIDLLLPAFAAVYLAQTTITPGRFNAWGVAVAVYFLVSGTTGLQLLGAAPFVQDLFYGAALIIAVTFSELVRRRRRGSAN